MGRDKALIEVGGRAMVAQVADAIARAGAVDVVVVGGDEAAFAALDLGWRADEAPGEGPLGGVISALGGSTHEIVFVASCDLPGLDDVVVRRVVAALDQAPATTMAAIPFVHGRRQALAGAYRRAAASDLRAAFDVGERGIHAALEAIEVMEVEGIDARLLADVDTPDDLAGYEQH